MDVVRRFRPLRPLLLSALLLPALSLRGDDLVRLVRMKISAGDLYTGEQAVEEYRRVKGVDPEYLDALGWLARGAQLLGKPERAAERVAELRREIPRETPDLIVPLGAAIEVEGRLIAAREGRGAAIRFWERELASARDVALRSRIRKNVNLVSLEGQAAPALEGEGAPALAGRPTLLFFWAHGCGDCKAQAPVVARVLAKYGARGLALVAPTRLYGTDEKWKEGISPEAERALVAKDWAAFGGPTGTAIPIDTETMVRYGASATPTLALVDRRGIVRLYSPTRMSESELSRRVEEVLSEP